MSKRLKARYILEIADVWPDVFIEIGYLKNKFIIGLLRKIELFCYAKARYIIALTQGIKKNIQKKIEEKDKVVFIPNGVNQELFSLDEKTKDEAKRLKIQYDVDNIVFFPYSKEESSCVYFRNSDTREWVEMASPAFQITSGDLDNDGTDDLIGIWPSQGGVWIKHSSDNSWELLSSLSPWGSYPPLEIQTSLLPHMIDSWNPGIPGPGDKGFKYLKEENLLPHKKSGIKR